MWEGISLGQPIVAVEIRARDFECLKRFYSELFGWEIDQPNAWHWAAINTGSGHGIQASMSQPDQLEGGGNNVVFYVEVDDLHQTLERAAAAGGTTVVEPWDEVGLAILSDPEGNRVGLLRRRT